MEEIFRRTLINEDYYDGVAKTEGYAGRIMNKIRDVLDEVFYDVFFTGINTEDTWVILSNADANGNKNLSTYIRLQNKYYNSLLGKYIKDQRQQLLIELISRLDDAFKEINWIVVGLGV